MIHDDICTCGAPRGAHESTSKGYGVGECYASGCKKYKWSGKVLQEK